jgi:hypothetical protein
MASNIKAVVRQSGSVLSQQKTLTLKNTLKDEITLKELKNVVEGVPNDGDTLVYNSILNKYEVKPITEINGGTF